ncbi:MAG: Flp pilus assembly complex ATPase component TadA [Dehalobacter sp.]|nr:Flp pilus assembly complex ATPase component TadA [Dehalobacter sp.]
MPETMRKLGQLLVESEVITTKQLEDALEMQSKTSKKLGEILIETKSITEKQLLKVLEFQYHIPYFDLGETPIDPLATGLITEGMVRKHSLIPIRKENNVLIVAMVDPLDFYAIDDVKRATLLDIKPAMATASDIMNAIERYYGKESAEKAIEELKQTYDLVDFSGIDDQFGDEVTNAPVVRLVNSVIQHAIKTNASDIHIEPSDDEMRIRYRIDGELQEAMKTSKAAHQAIVTRIKIMGQMDIAEKRLPQDGRIEVSIDGNNVDLRLSILPTVHGEKIVIRVLGMRNSTYTKSELGFTTENLELFDRIIKSPNGIILVSGPTGSGKTTTLYAVMRELNKPTVNIITVEDPVEYRMDGINQVQVNTKAGLTFASGLRSILRQDPDIIMIGEIRDSETAQIAIRSAITGHLVLSTIHTNDAASSILRLVDMGIESYLVSSAVVGLMAQRLVRKICTKCKTSYRPEHAEMMLLKLREPQPLYKGTGCPACNYTGYHGRTAIHEIIPINKDIREMVNRGVTPDQIRHIAGRFGYISLRDTCTRLVLDGTTTTEELLKVTYSIE